jgi:beta-lactamase class A
MKNFLSRRTFLVAVATAPLIRIQPANASDTSIESEFIRLEKALGGRIGMDVYDTAHGRHFGYRQDERFAMCSTFKIMLVGAILAQSVKIDSLLACQVMYAQSDLVNYSPVTGKHVADGMAVSELCKAALQHSDNTAANLLIKLLGGVSVVTSFARSIGDLAFRLDRYETELNAAVPGDERDTSTPAAMSQSLRTLVLGNVLPQHQRKLLEDWLRGNTTGMRRIRAGLPSNWEAGDKTGSGDYGTTNDVALIWPPNRAPISLAIYYTQDKEDAKWNDEAILSATKIVMNALQ